MNEETMTPTFVHLRVHSEYSIVDGIVRIDDLAQSVSRLKMPAVALTDHSNLFAAIKFYRAAINAKIKPILGADVFVLPPTSGSKAFPVTFLCQNKQGYQNLIQLISLGYTEGQVQNQVQLRWSWLESRAEGLIVLSGAMQGELGAALISQDRDKIIPIVDRWSTLFSDRFYLEIQRTGQADEGLYNERALLLAEARRLPIVATHPVCFLEKDDFDAHEARVCIYEGSLLEDARRVRRYTQAQYLKSPIEMEMLFADLPDAIANTVEIAKRCTVSLKMGDVFLPDFKTPDDIPIEQYLEQQSEAGLDRRLNTTSLRKHSDQDYLERLQLELSVITRMGFSGYFLIVADFIRWARENDIPVGPGRGSGAGSLVAYALKITDLDPLYHDLLFERFLNPERVSLPDFDIDFCMEGRDRVIDYVSDRYGKHSVSQIITYGTMAARAVIRDVGRVLNHPYGFVDKLAKLIPFELGMTLEKALKQEEQLKERYDKEDEVKVLFDLAMKLEGIARNVGKHAGGVVIAPAELTQFTPIYCESNGGDLVTQFDKDDIETIGLVKFDFLGLRTLTIIHRAVKSINEYRQTVHEALLDIQQLPMDDELTFNLLKACETTAVFQLESRGMKDLVKRLQPDFFEEIVALVALFRPGPLQSGMVEDFIDRKHGRAVVTYLHPALKPILAPTYGVILYQEQVMQIAQVLAGYTLGSADLLRRAMGKKKFKEMAKQRQIFIEGATSKHNVDAETAAHIFDLMEKFAGYGFNRSHSAAYALLSYQTAWLKAHYPAEYMAAVLSADMDHTDKVVIMVEECRRMNIEIISPSVNTSDYYFTPQKNAKITYGLGAVKGVGLAAISVLLEERKQGSFKDFFDFCTRIDLRKLNRRVLEALIKSGAMDDLGPDRATIFASIDKAMAIAEKKWQAQETGQASLFDMEELSLIESDLGFIAATLWTDDERLRAEKESLGLYLSGHPLGRYLSELSHMITANIADLEKIKESRVTVAGFVTAMRVMNSKRGDRIAFLTLDDRSGRLEIAVFAEPYHRYRELLVKDKLLIISGIISRDEYTGGFRMSADTVCDINEARKQFVRALTVEWQTSQLTLELSQLEMVLAKYRPGYCPVSIRYLKPGNNANIVLGAEWKVYPSDELLDQLRLLLGEQSVYFEYR